jgi:hypothetical protein
MRSVCAICDKPGVLVTLREFPMHEKCAPSHWLADEQDRVEFMGRVREVAETRSGQWSKWK